MKLLTIKNFLNMKLRNLMYATMIACAFASCSKDDEVINGGETADATAKLNVKFEMPTQTKSLPENDDEGASESSVKSLQVYVFKADGSYEATFSKTNTNVSENNALTAGEKKVVVVANADAVDNPRNINDVYDASVSILNEKNGQLTMNSKTYTITLVAGKTNYLGYTSDESTTGVYLIPTEGDLLGKAVKLYRNVAKIVLTGVTLAPNDQYKQAQLTINKVYILHGNPTSKLVGGSDAWNSTYSALGNNDNWFIGSTVSDYAKWVEKMSNITDSHVKQNYVDKYDHSDYYNSSIDPITLTTKSANHNNVDAFYAYENLNTTSRTLLVVEGVFSYGNQPVTDFPTRYYSVAVGDPNQNLGTLTKPDGGIERINDGILRNVQYNVSLTVKGPGYETPFGPDQSSNTNLNVKVEVVPFGTVNQTPVIE